MKLIALTMAFVMLLTLAGCGWVEEMEEDLTGENDTSFGISDQEKIDALEAANTRLQAEKKALVEKNEELEVQLGRAKDVIEAIQDDMRMLRRLNSYSERPYSVAGMVLFIDFDHNKLYNKARTTQVAKEIVAFAKKHNNKVKITVEGYASKAGPAKLNKWFSKERAEGVAHKIFSLGNANNDLDVEIKAHGETSRDQRRVTVSVTRI